MQYTSKGTVDGGYVNKERLRLRLRRARTVSATALADLHAVRTAVDTRVSDADRSVTVLEDRQHKADRQRRVAADAAAEARKALDAAVAEVLNPISCIECYCDKLCEILLVHINSKVAMTRRLYDLVRGACFEGSNAVNVLAYWPGPFAHLGPL